MAQTHLPPQWRQRLMAILNGKGWLTGQFGSEQMRLLEAWQRSEGGTADWNPLNTTLHVRGGAQMWQGGDFNDVGVCNYLKATYGVMATAATLLNGNYNHIVGFLQGGVITAEQCVEQNRGEFQTWGTNPDTILAVLAGL